jgi:hypothetical protein
MGGEEDGAELVRPLRELAPEMDTVATVPAKALSRLHQDPEDPTPGKGDGMLLSDLPAETIETIVAVAGAGTQSPFVSLEIRTRAARSRSRSRGTAPSRRSPASSRCSRSGSFTRSPRLGNRAPAIDGLLRPEQVTVCYLFRTKEPGRRRRPWPVT